MGDQNRREFLRTCLAGVGWLAAAGCAERARPESETPQSTAPATGVGAELVPFLGEEDLPLEQAFGRGLDGRLFTDLSGLTAEAMVTPTERFFVRTRCSELRPEEASWKIRIGGRAKQPQHVTLATLKSLVRPAGIHVMECSGNSSGGHFGMLSAAAWSGVPVLQLLETAAPLQASQRVLISGFDKYPRPSRHRSVPGASWIFTREQLRQTGAFIATEMNSRPLTPDHGAPVRLIVPGWYGCTCIKWVDQIDLVADDEPATPQMQEFAARTHQEGVPKLARDYRPAALDQAALALRVERLPRPGSASYRITGITWGGNCVTSGLMIRFRPDEEYQPVRGITAPQGSTNWALWECDWQPTDTGEYAIQLQLQPAEIPQYRLGLGHYTRYVQL